MTKLLLLSCIVLGTSILAFGQTGGIGLTGGGAAPEIDASQATTVLALLSGASLIIRGRRKKQS